MRFVSRLASSVLASSVFALVPCAPCFAEPIAIGGQVIADGQPAAGARVALMPVAGRYEAGKLRLAGEANPEPEAETRSDAKGRFRLAAPRDGLWKVRFELDGWVPWEVRLEPLLYAVELGTVELESDAELRVRITAGDARPAARVVAYPIDSAMSRAAGRRMPLFKAGGGWRPLFTGTAGDDGNLRVPASGEEKTWILEVTAAGFVAVVHESSARRSVEIDLQPGVRRVVETVDAQGEPRAGVLLFSRGGYLPLAKTDGRGRATLVGPAGVDLKLTAIDSSGRYGALRVSEEDSTDQVATLVLEEPRTISGRVVEQVSREPIAGALVWVGTMETNRTDAEGGYTVRVPAPGSGGSRRLSVQASAAGYVSGREAVSPAAEEAGSRAGPTIALEPAAGLRGRVVDADQVAVAGVEIAVSALPGGMRRRFTSGGGEKQRTRSAKDGRFEVSGLAAGEGYRLRLVKSGFAPGTLEVEGLRPLEQRSGLEAVLHRGRRAVGLVVDEQEVPIAGAVVRLEEPSGPRRRVFRMPGSEVAAPRDTTGVDGGFAISDLAAGRYDLKVESPGFGPVAVPGVEVPAGAGEVDIGTVVLSPGVAIEGRVTGAGGRPLAGVEIRNRESSEVPLPAAYQLLTMGQEAPAAITGVDGRFAVPDRRPGERLDLIVAGDGYVAITVAGVVAPPEEPLEVVLQQASRISGRVLDAGGEPIAGAAVQARPEGLAGSGGRRMSSFNRARTDAEGYFELLDVEPGFVTLVAGGEGFQEARLSGLEAPAGGELRDVELTLHAGALVSGTVLDAGGLPVADVQVFISATGDPRPEGFARTDGDGRFEISGVRPGKRTVTASDEKGQRVAKGLDVETGNQAVELRFAGGVEVSGRVVDGTGLGVAGAEVWLESAARAGWRGAAPRTASSADGDFTVTGVAPGKYRLSAEREGFARGRGEEQIEVSSSAIRGLEVRLGQGTTLSGRILGLELDDLAQVEVRADRRFGQVDFEGAYSVENLSPGEVTVLASIPGSGRQVTRRVTIEEGVDALILDLEFGGGYTLTGRVVVGDQPLAGASVRLLGVTVRTSGRATTDSRGRFRVEGLDAGGYDLWVRGPESGAEHSESLELLADDDVLVQLGTGRVAGRVRDRADASAVDGVHLSLIANDEAGSARGFGRKSATSDSRGQFSFAAVPAGSWWLRASRAGYADAEVALTTLPGEAVEDFEILLSATAGLSFDVMSAAGVPPSRVDVSLLGDAGRWVAGGSYRTLEGGRVEITTVPDGSWEMLIAAGDSATLSLRVTAPGDAGRVQLSPGGGVIVEVPELADGRVGAGLTITGPDGRPHRGVTRGGGGVATYALRAGQVSVTNLAPGSWTLTVTAGERSWSAGVMVTPGAPVEVTLP